MKARLTQNATTVGAPARPWSRRLILLLLCLPTCSSRSGGAIAVAGSYNGVDPGTDECRTFTLVDCNTSNDCPAGSACGPSWEHLRCTDCPDRTSDRACHVYGQSAMAALSGAAVVTVDPSHALSHGFGVPETPLERVSGGGYARFTWQAPQATTAVTCVLFACTPELGRDGSGIRILNYDTCAIAEQRFDATVLPVQVDLGSLSPRERDAPRCLTAAPRFEIIDGSAPPLPNPKPVLTSLSVGCWSYGATNIISTSDLARLKYVEANVTSDWAVPDGDCTRNFDGTQCWDAELDAFGACFAGSCNQRCVVDSDCAMLSDYYSSDTPSYCQKKQAGDAGASDAAVPRPNTDRTCRRLFPQYALGVCSATCI